MLGVSMLYVIMLSVAAPAKSPTFSPKKIGKVRTAQRSTLHILETSLVKTGSVERKKF